MFPWTQALLTPAVRAVQPDMVGPVTVPLPPCFNATSAAASLRPTGSLSRGCKLPMNVGVADEFLINGASGASSRFHRLIFHTQRLDANGVSQWQHGGGCSVPLFVHAHEFGMEAFIEQIEVVVRSKGEL